VRPRGTGYKVELAFDDADEALAWPPPAPTSGRLKPATIRDREGD